MASEGKLATCSVLKVDVIRKRRDITNKQIFASA